MGLLMISFLAKIVLESLLGTAKCTSDEIEESKGIKVATWRRNQRILEELMKEERKFSRSLALQDAREI